MTYHCSIVVMSLTLDIIIDNVNMCIKTMATYTQHASSSWVWCTMWLKKRTWLKFFSLSGSNQDTHI